MPSKNFRAKKYTTKPYTKFKRSFKKFAFKQKRKQLSVVKWKSPTLLPDMMKLKLKWLGTWRIGSAPIGAINLPTAFTLCWNTLRGTSIDVTNRFTQPDTIGSHKYGIMYQSYRIRASKIRITVVNLKADTDFCISVYPAPAGTTQLATNTFVDYGNVPYVKYGWGGIMGGGADKATVRNYCTTAKIYGVEPQVIKDEADYWGGLGNDATPTDPATTAKAFWLVNIDNSANAYTTYSGGVEVEMTQYVEFFNRRDATFN